MPLRKKDMQETLGFQINVLKRRVLKKGAMNKCKKAGKHYNYYAI